MQQPGDTVWMKMRGFPRWPGTVCSPRQGGVEVARQRKSGHTLVHSFGDHMYVWVVPSNLTAFTAAAADEALLKGGSIRLKQAITEARAALGGRGAKRQRGSGGSAAEAGGDGKSSEAAEAAKAEARLPEGSSSSSELQMASSSSEVFECAASFVESAARLQQGLAGPAPTGEPGEPGEVPAVSVAVGREVSDHEQHIEHLVLMQQNAKRLCETIDIVLVHYRKMHGVVTSEAGKS